MITVNTINFMILNSIAKCVFCSTKYVFAIISVSSKWSYDLFANT